MRRAENMDAAPARPSTVPHAGRPLRALVTVGPTHEPIDEVRYLGNRSSGRMGMAIAESLAAEGCAVTVLHREEADVRAAVRSGATCPMTAYKALGTKPKCGTCVPAARTIVNQERAIA